MASQLVLELRFLARPDRLRGVRDRVRDGVRACGCNDACAADIVLAVDEACQNIIRHAYAGDPDGVIELRVERRADELVFSLRDDASAVDPEKVKPRDLDDLRAGGLGTHLIRQVMDRADFVPPPTGHGNLLRMVKRIA